MIVDWLHTILGFEQVMVVLYIGLLLICLYMIKRTYSQLKQKE